MFKLLFYRLFGMVMYIYLLTLGMITQKYSQKQKYTISKNLNFKKFFRGGQTHLDKKNLPNFQVHGLETLKGLNPAYCTCTFSDRISQTQQQFLRQLVLTEVPNK